MDKDKQIKDIQNKSAQDDRNKERERLKNPNLDIAEEISIFKEFYDQRL